MIGNFGLLSQIEIEALLRAPESINALISPGDIFEDERFHCVDNYWHALHLVLTGKAWGAEPPLDFIVAGGTEVSDVDVG